MSPRGERIEAALTVWMDQDELRGDVAEKGTSCRSSECCSDFLVVGVGLGLSVVLIACSGACLHAMAQAGVEWSWPGELAGFSAEAEERQQGQRLY